MSVVRVRIFLAGSHEHAWACDRDHPSLATLMSALSSNAHPRMFDDHMLVRLVVPDGSGGERGLVFLRTSLVAVETEPALPDLMPTIHTARRAADARRRAAMGEITVQRPGAAIIHDFLPQALHDEVFESILAREADFRQSAVRSGEGSKADDYDFRRSKVHMGLGGLEGRVVQRVLDVLPGVLERMEEPFPERHHMELQVTAHNHLDYFKAHVDNATGDLRQRRVSWVYYLHRRPRPFTGGELVLFDSILDGDERRMGEGFRVIEPADNSIVFFQSHFHHQVRTVRCESRAFEDSRFTVNGWLRDLDITD